MTAPMSLLKNSCPTFNFSAPFVTSVPYANLRGKVETLFLFLFLFSFFFFFNLLSRSRLHLYMYFFVISQKSAFCLERWFPAVKPMLK